MRTSPFNRRLSGFSRLELVATGACAFLLLILVVAAAPRSRESGQRAVCANNLKRLGAAIQSYSSEHEGLFPPRNSPTWWYSRLQPYYEDSEVLMCPADSPGLVPRSYVFNGFDDYWHQLGISPSFTTNEFGIPEAAIPKPSETLAFGEKITSSLHNHVKILQQDHLLDIDHSRHFRTSPNSGERQGSGSNYGFLDGSVRFLRFGEAFSPINLWAVTDWQRTNTVAQ
jgi:prepilin-type processing-associated H-X9-DG protein